MDSTWTQNKPENSRVSFLLNYFEVPIKKKIFGVTNSSQKNYDITIFPNQKKKNHIYNVIVMKFTIVKPKRKKLFLL